MLITQTFSWPAATWPATSAASQYTLYQVYPGAVTALQSVTTNSATLTFDDSLAAIYQVRPSSGGSISPFVAPASVGPECAVFCVNYVPCRAWLRNKVRKALADRADGATVQNLKWPDDELNEYIQEGLVELNVLFPIEVGPISIPLLSPAIDSHGNTVGTRTYALPADLFSVKTVEYVTPDGKLHLYLKEKPWRGGETSATSYLGYPKLGIMLSPLAGRFYPGHYFVWEGSIVVDWDPVGDGDYLNILYMGRRALPVNDGDVMSVSTEDMEVLSIYVQMKCWLRVFSSDISLSRWRGRDDGSRRDDEPTLDIVKQLRMLYDQRINDRRETRPRTRRLVRR